jgi:hypothetical protein
MPNIAQEIATLWEAADPTRQIAYCPALAICPSGRLVGTMLVCDRRPAGADWLVKAYTSDDGGHSWTPRADFPMVDAVPFVVGSTVYILGGREDLKVARSDDWGETWTEAKPLRTGKLWYTFPGSIVQSNGRIYMARECRTEPVMHGFPTWILAPVVMSASIDDDLTRPEAWTYSNVLSFQDMLAHYGKPHLFGVPFYEPGLLGHGRTMAKSGWGEANLVQISDPDHVWCDPTGRTFHILMRTNSGRSNLACLAKAVEQEDGSIEVGLETAPSGEPILYTPFPGGHIGFVIQHDPVTGLHWLVSNQATDSMRRVDRLDPRHYGMPFNERGQLALYFSRNCVDWCFASLLAANDETVRSSYHGSFVIDGDDLVVMMRTADSRATNAHNSNLITVHRVPNFRGLAY